VTLRGSHLDEVWAQQGGIWIAQVKAGERVQQGQRLGFLYSVGTFETVEWVTAPYEGYGLGVTDTPVINTGDALVNLYRLGA
jgi:predicted deacylase